MTTHRDHDRSISAWLVSEAPDRAPDDVLEASRERLRHTRQRRAWMPAWRYSFMNSFAKLAGAAAAILVVGFVGYQLLPGTGGPGGPSTGPTIAPTPPPTPPGSPPAGEIPAGTYAWAWSDGSVTFDLPAGWTGTSESSLIHKHPDQAGEISFGIALPGSPNAFTHVVADACIGPDGDLVEVGPSIDDLVGALDDQASTDATITEVNVGGPLIATRVDLVDSAGLDRATCAGGVDGPIWIWGTATESTLALAPGYRARVYIVDLDGDRIVFASAISAAANPDDLAELDAIIQSMRWPTRAE
jgi:hypothetical protein